MEDSAENSCRGLDRRFWKDSMHMTDITPYTRNPEMDLEHYMNILTLEGPPSPTPSRTPSRASTHVSEYEHTESSESLYTELGLNEIEHALWSDATQLEELWSECVYDDDDGETEEPAAPTRTTILPDYNSLQSPTVENPPSYYDAPPSCPSAAAIDRGIAFTNPMYLPPYVDGPPRYDCDYELFNSSQSNPFGYFPTPPPPYIPLPDSQDFGLDFISAGMFAGMPVPPTGREFERFGFNSPLTPPPPYDALPYSTSFPPMNAHLPYGLPHRQPTSTPFQSDRLPYLPHPPSQPQFFALPMENDNGLLLTPTPSSSMVLIVPMSVLQHALSAVSQGHQGAGQRPMQGTFESYGREQCNNRGWSNFNPNLIQLPRTPLASSTPTTRRGLNPYSATFIPKIVGGQNLCRTRGEMSAGGDWSQQPPPFQYRLDAPARAQGLKMNSFCREENFPYVSNVWDFRVVASLKPSPTNFAYYVPPRVDDNDYFGGQMRIWNERMMSCFGFFVPHIWILQGLPDFNKHRNEGWSHFTITCKLRFCCRRCLRAWTSMRGKIHFAFRLDNFLRQGIIVMKIFGQVCNHEKCDDHNFQTPACYPEEIERVLWKLSEYIGYMSYHVPLSRQFYNEPDKAIRVGNPKSPHRPALCQACQQGLCSRV